MPNTSYIPKFADTLVEGDWARLRDRVAEWKPDLIVAVARKAPRIDEALDLRFGAVATTISDLAIRFCRPWIVGARVAVIDDIVNVGTTIQHALEELNDLGAAEVRAFALHSRSGSETSLPLSVVGQSSLTDSEYAELTRVVPRLLRKTNKPYDLDFPVLAFEPVEPIATGLELFRGFRELFGDDTYDLTTPVDAARTARMTIDLPGFAGLAKIRVYYDEGRRRANVVPMRVVNPLPIRGWRGYPKWHQDAATVLMATLGDDYQSGEEAARLGIFLESLAIMGSVSTAIASVLRPSHEELLSTADAELVFGPAFRTLANFGVDDLVDMDPRHVSPNPVGPSPALAKLWPQLRGDVERRSPTNDPISRAVTLFNVLAEAVGSEGANRYRLTWPYSEAEISADRYRRLRIGFTFEDLVAILAEADADERTRADWRRTVSKLLDLLIDSGMVVPAIARYGEQLFRIYRKGEYGDRERAADSVAQGLYEYGDKMSATRISKLAVITSLALPQELSAHVTVEKRGNVYSLDPDLIDDDAEVVQFLARTGKIHRVGGGDG